MAKASPHKIRIIISQFRLIYLHILECKYDIKSSLPRYCVNEKNVVEFNACKLRGNRCIIGRCKIHEIIYDLSI